MNVLSKMILISGAAMVSLAHEDDHSAATTGTPDLLGIEVGELLATSCKPITIYTHECQVITVQPSTSTETMTTDIVTSVPVTESEIGSTTTSDVVVVSTTSGTEDVPQPTEDGVISAAACPMQQLYMEIAVFLFGLAVLYTA